MRDLGLLNQFLGIQVVDTTYGLLLHQQQYVINILNKASMNDAKPVTLTSISQVEFSNPSLYHQLVGSLQDLTLKRPDIQFAVNQLSQSMHKPLNINFEALKHLLRFIEGIIDTDIPLYKDSLQLTSFTDADWACNTQNRKSISGYYNFMGKTLISWQVKKQSTMASSSTKAEYRALATVAAEVI